MALTDDDMLYLVDTYQGAELSTYSLIDMQHKNIFTFNGDQFNLDNYPLIMEDTDDGRLWFVNMKTSKEKFQRRSQIRYLNDFHPIKQLDLTRYIMNIKEDTSTFGESGPVKRIAKMWVLGVDAHEQVLTLAEISTSIEHHTVVNGDGLSKE